MRDISKGMMTDWEEGEGRGGARGIWRGAYSDPALVACSSHPHPAAVSKRVGFSFLMGFCSEDMTPAWNLPPYTYSTCLETSGEEETGGCLSLLPAAPLCQAQAPQPRGARFCR